MKKEAAEGVQKLKDARWRTAQATGVSEKTVSRILSEKRKADETGSGIRSPHQNKKPRKCLRRDIAAEHQKIIRNTVETYQSEFKKPPSLNGLRTVLEERIGFTGCKQTLRHILVAVGYDYKPTSSISNRDKVLVKTSLAHADT